MHPPISTAVTRPPSILKKPKGGTSTDSSKTAKILPPAAEFSRKARGDTGEGVFGSRNAASAHATHRDGDSLTRARPVSSTEEPIASNGENGTGSGMRGRGPEGGTKNGKSVGPQDDAKPKSAAKRTVLAKTAASKRRPIITQRKSSQSSSSITSHVAMSPASGATTGSPARAMVRNSLAERFNPGEEEPVMPRSRPGGPHPSPPRGPAVRDNPIGGEPGGPARGDADRVERGLVDRDFRLRFAARTHVERPGIGPGTVKSTATAATCADHQAVGITELARPSRHGKWSENFHDEIVQLKPPGSSGPRAKDDSETQSLTRTKSQLTLLLERDRQRNYDGNDHKEAR